MVSNSEINAFEEDVSNNVKYWPSRMPLLHSYKVKRI